MRRSITYVSYIAAGLLIFVAGCTTPGDEPVASSDEASTGAPLLSKSSVAQERIPDQYIIVLNDDARNVPDVAADMARGHGLTRGFMYQHSIKGFSATVPAGRLNALRRDPRVKYIEQDRVVTLAPPVTIQKRPGGGTTLPEQSEPWGINRVGGSGASTSHTAWIIDTGIDLDHPDLNVDGSRSTTFIARTTPDDQNGHGTHVAGIIAAKNNTVGVIGVAPGATVVSVRVLDRRGSGTVSGVIAGVDYVAANGKSGDVANMSLGGGVSTTLDAAVLTASAIVKFALAAGNESDNADNHSPARVNGPNIYTISAIDANDKFAYFSNYGNPPVDYAAPGVSVLSLYKDGGMATMSGTSMAAPHVAGILLLGNMKTDGTALGDPDGNADPIAHR